MSVSYTVADGDQGFKDPVQSMIFRRTLFKPSTEAVANDTTICKCKHLRRRPNAAVNGDQTFLHYGADGSARSAHGMNDEVARTNGQLAVAVVPEQRLRVRYLDLALNPMTCQRMRHPWTASPMLLRLRLRRRPSAAATATHASSPMPSPTRTPTSAPATLSSIDLGSRRL